MSRSLRKHLLVRGGIFLVVVALVYVWRPLFHFIFYDMTHSPESFIFWSLTLLGGLYLWFRPPVDVEKTRLSAALAVLFD